MWRSNDTRNNLLKWLGYEVIDKKLVFTKNEEEFICTDVETSGLDTTNDRIIQISALKCKYNSDTKKLEVLEELDEYIKPEIIEKGENGNVIRTTVEPKIEELTGITNEFLSDKPSEKEVFPKISKFFGNSPIFVAYNSRFDKTFITNMFIRNNEPFKVEEDRELDVLKMAKDLVSKEDAPLIENSSGKTVPTYKLFKIAELYGVDKIPGLEGSFHSSIFDTKVMTNLLNVFISEYIEKLEEELNKPEVEKKRAKVESVRFWEGYRGFSRIYINAILDGEQTSYFYDIRNKSWGNKDKEIIEKTLMEDLKNDTLAFEGVKTEEELVKKVSK